MTHPIDTVAVLSTIVGVASLASDAGFSSQIARLLPQHDANTILAILGIVGLVASQILRTMGAPSSAAVQQLAKPPADPPKDS